MSLDVAERLGADEVFPAIVALTQLAVPGAAGVGIRLRVGEHWVPVGAPEPLVQCLTEMQIELGEGPEALATGALHPVHADELGTDLRWPRFGRAAADLGARSVMAFPLLGPEEPLGVMSVYGTGPAAFGERMRHLGGVIAGMAGLVARRVWALDRAEETVAGLRAAMPSRTTVDQAVGILRSRSGADGDEAMARLRAMSQRANVRLPEIAASLVEEAARQARARRAR